MIQAPVAHHSERRRRRRTRQPVSKLEVGILSVGLIAAVISGVVAYRIGGPYGERLDTPRVQRIYDDETGELELLIMDLDGDLRFDTWSYWDGDRLARRELDDNEDGAIDRWQYFDEDAELSREGFSTTGGEAPDAWRYFREDGGVERVEYMEGNQVSKIEFYRGSALMRVERDTDGDGEIDDRVVFFEEPPP